MNTLDQVTLTGALQVSINGTVVREVNNLVVTAGKEWVTSRMGDASAAVMSHMAIGIGTTAASVVDTTLESEVTRAALTTAGGVVTGNAIVFQCTYAADDPNVTAPATTPVTEAGIFNDGATGVMLARTVFPVVNKGESDTMTVSWTVTIS